MSKVLILTTSTGEGHNQAANSIGKTFEEKGYEVIQNDFLQSNSKVLTTAFVGGYMFSASILPKLYGIVYNITNTKFTTKLLSFVFLFVKKKVLKYINEVNPDLILLTHPFSVSILGDLKKNGLTIPTISIITDFMPHYSYINPNIDAYITGSEYTKRALIDSGINSDIIFPFGIPIRKEFFENLPEINSTRDEEYFNILLMSGSMGLKNISFVLKELLNNSNKLRITVVCGNNVTLKESLSKEYSRKIKDKKLHILGFSRDIDYLMEYSDLLISKPGGLTSTECICKGLPLLIPFVIPGQETENADFLTKNNYAFKIDSLLELNYVIDDLINNPTKLEDIHNNLNNLSSTYSLNDIVKLGSKLIERT